MQHKERIPNTKFRTSAATSLIEIGLQGYDLLLAPNSLKSDTPRGSFSALSYIR